MWSGTGGAQYSMGSSQEADALLVFAEAFERDADPEDFLWLQSSPTNVDISYWFDIRGSCGWQKR